jgi:pyrroloquinoline quinone biosynthesis protein E
LRFDTVSQRPLKDIWQNGEAFQAYRGDAWMPKACRSCSFKEADWGGCRCQALALAGDAAAMDPTCEQSPHHGKIRQMAQDEAAAGVTEITYRDFSHSGKID